MNRDLFCVASTLADTAASADKAGTLSVLLRDLTILFAGVMTVTLHELNHQAQMQALDEKVHQS